MTNLESRLKKQRHHFADKDPYSQSYDFSSSQVQISELDDKKDWVPKKWCFQTVVMEKILEGPCTTRRSSQLVLKEINPEYSLEGLVLKLKLQYFGNLMRKANSLGKTLMLEKIEGGRRRGWEDNMARCHCWLNGHEFELTLGDIKGQGNLTCCSPWSFKELDMAEQLNNNNYDVYEKKHVKWFSQIVK